MNKTEHEKLFEIMKLIWLMNEKAPMWLHYSSWKFTKREEIGYRVVDVREIIFTPEFKDALFDYLENNYTEKKSQDVMEEIWFELHDPVTYLYKTLWLWEK
jgi:hypothetical protein